MICSQCFPISFDTLNSHKKFQTYSFTPSTGPGPHPFSFLVIKYFFLEKSNWQYLGHFSLKWKNETTFFSPTFKVEEIKVVLFFHFEIKWMSYGHFYVSHHLISETKNQKSRKWPYLTNFSPKWKNKTALFPSTLKVGEKKVV